jgi:hypothetical protein
VVPPLVPNQIEERSVMALKDISQATIRRTRTGKGSRIDLRLYKYSENQFWLQSLEDAGDPAKYVDELLESRAELHAALDRLLDHM